MSGGNLEQKGFGLGVDMFDAGEKPEFVGEYL